MTGRLIAFEGGEACGKSTQAALLAEHLGAVLTHEPGGTAIGARIRELVLDPTLPRVAPWTEALLMAADRAQHVAEIVAPALERGEDVVTDRFTGSSLAYQGFGRGLDVDELRQLSKVATRGLDPTMVVLLDAPPEVTGPRRKRRPDRFESEDAAFHERVADGYRALAAEDPERWLVVDGRGGVEEVADRVWTAVKERLG